MKNNRTGAERDTLGRLGLSTVSYHIQPQLTCLLRFVNPQNKQVKKETLREKPQAEPSGGHDSSNLGKESPTSSTIFANTQQKWTHTQGLTSPGSIVFFLGGFIYSISARQTSESMNMKSWKTLMILLLALNLQKYRRVKTKRTRTLIYYSWFCCFVRLQVSKWKTKVKPNRKCGNSSESWVIN